MLHRLSLFAVLATGSVALAGPTERRVTPNALAATTAVETNWGKFVELGAPNYAADGDPATAWMVAGAKLTGATLHVTFAPLDKTTKVRLRIHNGAAAPKGAYAANARAKDVIVTSIPARASKLAMLEDKEGWQEVVVEQPSGALAGVDLAIASTYPGSKTKDLFVADVEVLATSETPDNPAFERERDAAQKTWRASRVAAAKSYNTKAQAPIYAHYDITTKDWKPSGTGLEAMLAAAEQDHLIGMSLKYAVAYAKQALAGDKTVHVTLAPKSSDVAPAGDGVQVLSLRDAVDGTFDPAAFRTPIGGARAILVGDFKATDVKDKLSIAEWSKQTGPCKAAETAWVMRGDATDPALPPVVRVLVIGHCAAIAGRTGAPVVHRERELFAYNPDNEAALVIGETHVEGYTWGLDHAHGMLRGAHALLAPQGKVVDAKKPDDDRDD